MTNSSDHHSAEAPKVSQAELKSYRVPIGFRDSCAGLLIPLNTCRRENWYMSWECEHEKHVYEQCQFYDYIRRLRKADKLRAEAQQATGEE